MVASQTVQTVGDDMTEFTKDRCHADSSFLPVAVRERSIFFAVGPATNHSDCEAFRLRLRLAVKRKWHLCRLKRQGPLWHADPHLVIRRCSGSIKREC